MTKPKIIDVSLLACNQGCIVECSKETRQILTLR